jgi:undecaprenyl-diphosphatase
MTWMQAIIMGLVQGLTEFLPVSSSAHLVFADHFLRLQLSEAETVSFDVLLHLGTLVAVGLYFRRDLLALVRGLWLWFSAPRRAWGDPGARLCGLLLVGTIPAGVAGVALKDFFSAAFQNVPGTAALLLVTAAMLLWISARPVGGRTLESATWRDALTIGLCQAVAILPGVSRSGATITGGLWRGLDREAAPRFSFLLSIPIILAGGLFDLKATWATGLSLPFAPLLLGFLSAAASGYLAVVLLLDVVRRGRLHRFAYYCIGVSLLMLGYWHFLVPKIAPTTLIGLVEGQVQASMHQGELTGVELGQTLRWQLAIQPARDPIVSVTARFPGGVPVSAPTSAHVHPLAFTPVRGSAQYVSEKLRILPVTTYDLPADGQLRDLVVVVRTRRGVCNELRIPVRVRNESLMRRRA